MCNIQKYYSEFNSLYLWKLNSTFNFHKPRKSLFLHQTPSQYERSIIFFFKNIVIYAQLACKDASDNHRCILISIYRAIVPSGSRIIEYSINNRKLRVNWSQLVSLRLDNCRVKSVSIRVLIDLFDESKLVSWSQLEAWIQK